jgi:hypothetical protein
MKQVKMYAGFVLNGKKMQKWIRITGSEFADRFKDPILKKAFHEMWLPEFSMLFMLFTFGYLHKKNAGYPVGGSTPISKALEEK